MSLPPFSGIQSVFNHALKLGYIADKVQNDGERSIRCVLTNKVGTQFKFNSLGLYGGGVNYWFYPASIPQPGEEGFSFSIMSLTTHGQSLDLSLTTEQVLKRLKEWTTLEDDSPPSKEIQTGDEDDEDVDISGLELDTDAVEGEEWKLGDNDENKRRFECAQKAVNHLLEDDELPYTLSDFRSIRNKLLKAEMSVDVDILNGKIHALNKNQFRATFKKVEDGWYVYVQGYKSDIELGVYDEDSAVEVVSSLDNDWAREYDPDGEEC